MDNVHHHIKKYSPFYIFGIVILIWGLNFLLARYSDAGTIGSMFGVVSSLFSGLALAGLVITIRLQQKQIDNQGEEVVRQRFESMFFHLVEIRKKLLSKMDSNDLMLEGKFENKKNSVARKYKSGLGNSKNEDIVTVYFVDLEKSCFTTYLRNIIITLSFFEKTIFSQDNKRDSVIRQEYMDIFRSDISEGEYIFLFHFGLRTDGGRLKELMENLSFFRWYLAHRVVGEDVIIRSYKKSAFFLNAGEWSDEDFK